MTERRENVWKAVEELKSLVDSKDLISYDDLQPLFLSINRLINGYDDTRKSRDMWKRRALKK